MNTKPRKNELSLMNVTLCFFVIFIHAASTAVSSADRTSAEYAILLTVWKYCSCAVPGFIFLAGLKLSLGFEKPFSYPKYLLGRVKRVLIPYIIAVIVYTIYFCAKGYAVFTPIGFISELLIGNTCAHFYFVVTIMQFYLTAPLWRALARRLDSGVRVAAALVASYFLMLIFGQYLADFLYIFDQSRVFAYADRVFTTYLFWWVAGLAAGRYYESFKTEASRSLLPASLLFALGALLDGFLNYIHMTGRANVWWLDTAHSFYIFTAILFLYALAVRLSDSRLPELLSPIDRVSYSIYLWHPLSLYVADSLTARLGGVSLTAALAIRLAFGFIVTIGLCCAVGFASDRLNRRLKPSGK